jgi:hypothetical protein
MKLRFTGLWIAALALLSSCGSKQVASSMKDVSGHDSLGSVGRGAKLRLIKNLEVPANSDQLVFEPVISEEYVNGQGNMTRQTYLTCGMTLLEPSLDRRVLQEGTEIVLSGEARTYPNGDKLPAWNIEAVGIASPSALTEIGCSKLVRVCWLGYCDPYQQVPVTIKDLESALKNVAKVERLDPVIIPSK